MSPKKKNLPIVFGASGLLAVVSLIVLASTKTEISESQRLETSIKKQSLHDRAHTPKR